MNPSRCSLLLPVDVLVGSCAGDRAHWDLFSEPIGLSAGQEPHVDAELIDCIILIVALSSAHIHSGNCSGTRASCDVQRLHAARRPPGCIPIAFLFFAPEPYTPRQRYG